MTFSVLLLHVLPCISIAVALHSEGDLMRRERRAQSIQLTSHGAFKSGPSDEEEQSSSDFCNDDFPVGIENTNNCSDPAEHSIITQENMCIEAARVTDVITPSNVFVLASEWTTQYPKGCFKYSCDQANPDEFGNTTCYFYNPIAIIPSGSIKGSPVCVRPKHLMGTQNTQGGCPTGYQKIMDETICSATAGCLSLGGGADFRIGEHNASRHLLFPDGCFVNNENGKVYFNPPSALGTGTNVLGTPICIVSVHNSQPATGTTSTPIP